MKNNNCGYVDKQGIELNTCEDLPVTFCKKCGRFYVLDRQGNREEISIQESEECFE